MHLLVGLGNPGPKYAANRHNIGFMAIDEIARQHNFSPWRRKFQGEVCEGQIGRHKVLLLKPTTYMNDSGRAISEACRFYKIDVKDVFVFHDELDLNPGKVKAKLGGGVAGHNGLRSTGAHIGNDFHRVRIGIGHPGRERVTQWVLGDFAKVDKEWLEPVIDSLAKTVPSLLNGDLGRFMTDLSQTLTPPVNGHKKTKTPTKAPSKKNDNKLGNPKEAASTEANQSNDAPMKSSTGSSKTNSAENAPKNAMAEALMRLVSKKKDQ
ncbi:aminoacyl-tRNA hydrolase [Cohaesibacter celericrescens]|uniref:Peptidyl-tRNA hydrolase n=1 Tax=Cohaesibacter celericrescens TaxID=2067669 RepID=A0A2N5XXK4_9HYPH|nr:aminoacyl-tRNA hydrolase [Cohaesibacter celericrescens]PLW79158.1 aminoacyl-tRNA hydrolase [Cohaesibacter celericrescens]